MSFSLWNAAAGGAQTGPTLAFDGSEGSAPPVAVSNGVFTVWLDFGANPYLANEARWLEIAVSGSTLLPRQPLAPTPFSLNTRGIVVDNLGRVGLGTTTPLSRLHVAGDVKVDGENAIELGAGLAKEVNAGKIGYQTFSTDALDIVGAGSNTTNRKVKLYAQGGTTVDGNVTLNGTKVIELGGGLTKQADAGKIGYQAFSSDALDIVGAGTSGTNRKLRLWAEGGTTVDGNITVNGRKVIELGGGLTKEAASGTIGYQVFSTDALDIVGAGTAGPNRKVMLWADGGVTITGELTLLGADFSERFDVNGGEAEPGTVVTIDPDEPGKLRVAQEAYDHRVAGIVSGAGGVRTALTLGQEGTLADGAHRIALSGRVYTRVDATFGAIFPGDLLTTSSTPGHAMKATDDGRSRGAILGKAMTGLSSGRGLVLVLVSLQ
ncbi:MAG: hypothetical protein ACKVU1_16860 [bacterium]